MVDDDYDGGDDSDSNNGTDNGDHDYGDESGHINCRLSLSLGVLQTNIITKFRAKLSNSSSQIETYSYGGTGVCMAF
jgi:hypothetical protein